MKRTTAIILTLASILLCGCPGLAACAISVYALTLTPQTLLIALQNYGFDANSVGNPEVGLWAARLVWGVVALVLILIPIVVGLVTLRKPKGTKMQPAMAARPVVVPPARPPMQEPPAMVSWQAPAPPAYVPPAYVSPTHPPAPEPEPLPPAIPPVQEQTPENQPEEASAQVFPTVEMPAPSTPEGATRLASNWCLVFVSGPSTVSTVLLGKKVSLGRSPENDVTIADPLMSRQHAVIELVGGSYQVTDLGSANGTAINDVLLTGPTHLNVGDQVKFGGTVFRFQPVYEMG